MLSADSLRTIAADAKAFANAFPFRHAIIDGFFEPVVCVGLLNEFPSFDQRYALNEMGEVGGKAVRSSVPGLGPTFAALDAYIRGSDFLDYVSDLTGIPDLLYDPDYEGGGTHENRDGQSLDVHVDFNYHPRTNLHRRLNLIVYLNPEWEASWGGSLQLLEDPWRDATAAREVVPILNRCVVFETNEVSWHGFTRIDLPADHKHLSRKSFAIYLYTRDRPEAETAPPHATIYVPPGMPAALGPGTTLDEDACMDLRVRFAQLRGQLKFLYEREAGFARQMVAQKRALDEATRAQRIDLQGYARVEAVSGLWPDGWASADVRVDFTPSRPISSMTIDLWVPSQMTHPQSFAISEGGLTQNVAVAPGERKEIHLSHKLAKGASASLQITATGSWQPALAGSGGDERALSWRLLGITLTHG